MYIDLGAEKLIAAEKNSRKIAVEIKSFLGSLAITEKMPQHVQPIKRYIYTTLRKKYYPHRLYGYW